MTFDDRRVFTAKDAEKVEIGSKVIVSDNLADLKLNVEMNSNPITIIEINPSSFRDRFVTSLGTYALCYVVDSVSDLKWDALKIGDLIREDTCTEMVVGIDTNPEPDEEDGLLYHVCTASGWISDEDLRDWGLVS